MLPPIEFWVEGDPKGQPRPRAFSRGGCTRVYDPGTAEGWKSMIANSARPFLPTPPLDCPVTLHVAFHMRRPKSHFKSSGVLKATAPKYYTRKPDADNLAKAVMDALTQLGFWQDDDQVVNLNVRKLYTESLPGAQIAIAETD